MVAVEAVTSASSSRETMLGLMMIMEREGIRSMLIDNSECKVIPDILFNRMHLLLSRLQGQFSLDKTVDLANWFNFTFTLVKKDYCQPLQRTSVGKN